MPAGAALLALALLPLALLPLALLALPSMVLAGLPSVTGEPAPSPAASPASSSLSPAPSPRPNDAWRCPVTPPGPAPADFAERLFGAGLAYGNDDLWVGGLGSDGVIRADPAFLEPDGAIGWKMGWWRITPGELTIAGRRLDAVAPRLRAEVPDGYGGSGFQASAVLFPTEGCWEVSGTVGDATLTFVTLVLTDRPGT